MLLDLSGAFATLHSAASFPRQPVLGKLLFKSNLLQSGRSDGGYIGIYTPPNQCTQNKLCGCSFPVTQVRFSIVPLCASAVNCLVNKLPLQLQFIRRKRRTHSGCLSQRYEGVLTWPSRPGNNDDTTSCQHVHVYKRCRSVVMQPTSATLNDPLMRSVGSPSIGSQRRHVMGTGQLLNLSDGSGAIDAGPLDSN